MTVAQLAFHQMWWAVKNLARRKVVPEDEMLQKYQGKNAIEWAEHHGKQGMAKEIGYYFITVRNSIHFIFYSTPSQSFILLEIQFSVIQLVRNQSMA